MPNAMPPSETRQIPVIYVFFGLIASGKSTLAQAWAWHKQLRCYNSDWVRKELAGINPTESRRETIDTGIYTGEFSRKTYATLLARAESRLRQNHSVILDASYQYARYRQEIRELAAGINCRLYFILCHCPEEEMRRRMAEREKDPAAVSDGRWEIYLKQKERFEAPDELDASELVTVNTQAPLEDLLAELDNKLP